MVSLQRQVGDESRQHFGGELVVSREVEPPQIQGHPHIPRTVSIHRVSLACGRHVLILRYCSIVFVDLHPCVLISATVWLAVWLRAQLP
jgi:hypothetical protein